MPGATFMKMGSRQSILAHSRLQPPLPFSFRYKRLPNSDLHEPLLLDEDYYERKEKQRSEIEAMRKKNVTMEKNQGRLEKEIRQMQSIISRLESAAVTGSLSEASHVAACDGRGSKTATVQQEQDTIQLRQRFSDYKVMAKKQEDAIQELQQKIASLEHEVADLTASLHQIQKKTELSTQKSTMSRSSLPPRQTASMAFPIPAAKVERSIIIVGNETVLGCFLASILLVSVLVGLSL